MRKNLYLKKILAWTIMSIVGLTAAPKVILGGDLPQNAMVLERAYRVKLKANERQLACLARNVYYEAGGESLKGQMAVAQVTINRARSQKYPNDICAVVSQSTVKDNRRYCQFSWYCDPKRNKRLVISQSHPSYVAAKKVFLEGHRLAGITLDTYFFHRHDVETNPQWSRKFVIKIGEHVFYRPGR